MNPFRTFAISFFIPVLSIFCTLKVEAQSIALAHMSAIQQQMEPIKKDMWDYISAVAHGKSAKKVEKRRKELLKTNVESRKGLAVLQFKEDPSLRDSCVAFLTMSYNILNDDYEKIVDMETIAEESYNAMEAYLTAQEMASDKLEKAGEMLSEEEKKFANKNGIKLIESTDKTSAKLETAGNVLKYYNKVYLLFFKSNKQELYLVSALSAGDLSGVEQNRNSLLKYSEEGLQKLDTTKSYKGDASMITVSKEVLRFYISEAKDKVPAMQEFFLKKENFEKIKQAMDAKSPSQRTQTDIDKYNGAVNEMNAASGKYNAINNELNKKRTQLIDNWNKTGQAFLDNNVPKYR